ncbi:hypothetical protein OIU76_022602 [Salix suchowensis]|nr:hypothetical protein OIU76_022602 [Salix suchowensis]
MLEVRDFPSVWWKPCEAQQSYRRQCWAFTLEKAERVTSYI